MKAFIQLLVVIGFAFVPSLAQQGAPGQQPQMPRGPRLQELQSYRVGSDGAVTPLATIEESMVSSLARLPDGRIALAHQWFPENDDAHFEHVAVRFSTDEGASWTKPVPIEISGQPDNERVPFDPTLVPLPDGRLRLYYIARSFDAVGPGGARVASAISSDGLHFTVEPGTRFSVEGKGLIDCTVALHGGMFHLFAPQMDLGPRSASRPQVPLAFHATSSDGLNFTRAADVELEGAGRWLGAAVSDGGKLCYFGTGKGVWFATSSDGAQWSLQTLGAVPLADPSAVRLRDGGWLVIGSAGGRNGPPLRGAPPK